MHTAVPIQSTRDVVGSMRALGYPTSWQGARVAIKHLGRLLDEEQEMPLDLHSRLVWLSREYGHRQASADDGIGKHTKGVQATIRAAQDEGYRPPGHVLAADLEREAEERSYLPGFDPAGRFSLRYVPGHQWARNDDVCGRLRDALAMTLRGKYGRREIAKVTGIYEEQLGRMRSRLGLRAVVMTDEQLRAVDGGINGEFHDRFRLVETRPGAFADAHRISEAVNEAEDVTLACLQHGLAVPMWVKTADYVPHIAKSHPAVEAYVAWLAEQATKPAGHALAA